MSVDELGNLWKSLKPENVLVEHPKGRGWTRLGLSTLWSSIKQRPLTLGLGRWKAGAKQVLETLPALFDSSPLRKTLELNLQPRWQAFRSSRASLAVAVTDTDAKQKHYFFHARGITNLPKPTWEPIGSQNILLDALMATSAIPLLFPSKGKYVDGGVVRNQPLGAALKLAGDGECLFILVPHADYLPDSPNVLNLAGRLLEIWLGAGLEHELRELGTKNIARRGLGKPLFPVCLIKATRALDEISGLLAFGKNVDELIQIGETDATNALMLFDPADPNTWPEEARPKRQ